MADEQTTDEQTDEQAEVDATMARADDEGWLHIEQEDTGGRAKIPAGRPDVLDAHERRGWHVIDPPEPVPFVPARGDVDPGETPAWVDLIHPDLPAHQGQRVPNNAAALQGAFEAGWRYPQPPEDAVKDELRELRPRGGRATAAQRAEAEQQAAADAAATNEPPVIETTPVNPTAAGDGTDTKE